MFSVALAVGLVLCVSANVSAQARSVLPAPPSNGPAPTWLENEVTRRFAAWQQLEQQWEALKVTRPASFVRDALSLCLRVEALPTEGEGKRGRREQLLRESCTEAIRELPACYQGARAARTGWTNNLKMPTSLARARACGSADALASALQWAVHAEPAALASAARAIAYERDVQRRADAAEELLQLSPCTRIEALEAYLSRSNEADPPALRLAESEGAAEVEQLWADAERLGARYVDGVAYQLAMSRIELYAASRAALSSAGADDLPLLEHARDGFACLHGFRDAESDARKAEQRLAQLRAEAERENACLASPACMEQREHREQRRLEAQRPVMFESAPVEEREEQACCKICHKGYACGDSCISRDKTCHKGQGCACDG